MKAVAALKFRFLPGLAASFLPLVAAAATFNVNVGVGGSVFSPDTLTIQEGDTVRWTNPAGGMEHNVTSDNGSFPASPTAASFVYEFTFNDAGTFDYHCTIHGLAMSGTITVTSSSGTADLAVQSVDATNGTYAPGDSISIDISIQNMGNATSAGYTVTFYASTNSTINASDTEIGSSARAALNAGQTSNFSVNAAFPNSIDDGSYFIGAIIEISDSNNANNTGMDNTTVTVETPAPAAELELTEVDVPPGSFAQGASISIDAEVENTGNAASGAFSIDYYASTNTTIGPPDRLIATENRASLDAGENSSGPFNASIPADLTPGTYFIGGIVNFSDGNSANNKNLDASSITVTGNAGFVINSGLNDTWKDTSTPRQGFFITVFPDTSPSRPEPLLFLAWFTYDTERPPVDVTAILGDPGARWLTALGAYSGNTATLDIELTQGGVFDSGTPLPAQTSGYGTITVTFTSCSAGEITYEIPSVGVSGTAAIVRVANDNVALCEAFSPP